MRRSRRVAATLENAHGCLWADGFMDGRSSFETGTLSLWRAADHAAAFAYSEGPHRQAIGAGRDGGWFRESWFGRFGVSGAVGAWPGLDPASVRGVSGPSREG